MADIAESVTNRDTNVDAFLRHSREENLLAIIEARKRQVQSDFHSYLEKHTSIDWNARLQKLKQEFGFSNDGNRSSSTADQSPASGGQTEKARAQLPNGMPSIASKVIPSFSDLDIPAETSYQWWDAKAQTFSQAISSLNEHRLMKQPVAICSLMSQLVRSLGSDVGTHQLADSWQIVAYLADEKHVEHNRDTIGRLLQPRHYYKQYSGAKQESFELHTRFLDRSRKYLENQFFHLVEHEIARNPQDARLGGSPTAISKIKAYVNIRFSKHGQWTMPNLEIINNSPVWAILFFLLRAGFLDDAVQFSLQNETYLAKFEKNWCSYISAYASSPDRKLPRQLSERLQNEFSQRIKFVSESTDPFKHALYKILGRCDLSRKSLHGILSVTEDWMWLQVSLAREAEKDEPGYQHFDLRKLQDNLVQFGPRHFNPKGNNALLYFQVLLMSAQFERAVHYLAAHSWTDAIHFAAVLAYYGLLRVAGDQAGPACKALIDDQAHFKFAFAPMIQVYARMIQKHSSIAAVEYLSLICLNTDVPEIGTSQRLVCHAAIRSLILETRDFAALLGDIRADGTREPGFIEKRMSLLQLKDEKQYLRAISENAAALSEQEGRVADAILLYHLSEEYDTVVGIINESLGASLLDTSSLLHEQNDSVVSSLTSAEDPALLAKNMLDLYTANASIYSSVSQHNKDSCTMLLSIVEARKKFAAGKFEESLAIIDKSGVLPLGDNITVSSIKNKSQAFNLLDDCVARNIPRVMLIAVACLRAKYESVSRNVYTDQSRSVQLSGLQRCAKNISVFAGILKYSINEDVRLQLEEALVSFR